MTPYVKIATYDVGTYPAFGLGVTVLADGSFLTAWTDFRTGYGEIYAQHISSGGQSLGNAFLVAPAGTAGSQPFITALGTGGYVISWQGGDVFGSTGVQARIYDRADNSVGTSFVVNTATAGNQLDPSITTLNDGSVVIAWWSDSPNGISVRHLDSSGVPTGPDIVVTTAAPMEGDSAPSVSALADGGFVVLWNHGVVIDDQTFSVLKAQTFNADGQATGSPVTVNDLPLYYNGPITPTVVGLTTGGFAVAYTSAAVPGGFEQDIALQIFGNDGSRTSGVILANAGDTYSQQYNISAAALPGGRVAITWNDAKFAVFDATGAPLTGPLDTGGDIGSYFPPGTLPIAATSDGKIVTFTRPSNQHDADRLILQVFSPENFRITSGGGGDSATYSLAENSAAVATVTTAGASQTVSFSIQGGADAALFQIDSASGVLSFRTAPDFEAPRDAGLDNVYDVVVRASSGSLFDDQALAITVTDVDDTRTYTGTARNDTFTAANGFDWTISGLAGNDTLTGASGRDRILGGAGNDKLDGGAGADTLLGGAGNDTYFVDNTGDVVREDSVAGIDDGGNDTVNASVSFTLGAFVENLVLTGTGNTSGTGNGLANTLTGNDGNNMMSGLDGKDTISGGAGDDLIIGGRGSDVLTGGTGADDFRFDVLETGANRDTIKDFVHGEDHLSFDRAAFTAFAGDSAGALTANDIAFGTRATLASQHLVYNQATGSLFYDADGAGGAAQVLIAVLTNKPVLDAGDFVLI